MGSQHVVKWLAQHCCCPAAVAAASASATVSAAGTTAAAEGSAWAGWLSSYKDPNTAAAVGQLLCQSAACIRDIPGTLTQLFSI